MDQPSQPCNYRLGNDFIETFPIIADTQAPSSVTRSHQTSPLKVIQDLAFTTPAHDPGYLIVNSQYITSGPDAHHVRSEIKYTSKEDHPFTEEVLVKQLADLTLPRNTCHSTIQKELLTYDRYNEALHKLRGDPTVTILQQAQPAMKTQQDKEYLQLMLGMNAAKYVKSGKPLLKGPAGVEVNCTCCSTTLTAHAEHQASILYGVGTARQCQFTHSNGHRVDQCFELASNIGLVVEDAVKWYCTPHLRRMVEHQVCRNAILVLPHTTNKIQLPVPSVTCSTMSARVESVSTWTA